MALALYVSSDPPMLMVWIPCPFCSEKTYSPDSPWIRKEIAELGCGWCEQSVKGAERLKAVERIDDLELKDFVTGVVEDIKNMIPPREAA